MTAPKLRFKEFCSEYNEYNLGKLLKSYRLGGNYSNSEIKTNFPLIKMGNLNRGNINLSKIEYIPNDEIINDEDRIQLGDLFFNTRNTLELVGKVAIWRNELPVAYYNSNLMRLEFENNFYMNFLLNTEKSLEKLKAIASGTTSVAAIYTKDLLKVKVNVPFVDEQTKIAFFLSAVDEKISQLTQKYQLLSQYKQGMMQKLFSQQIRFKADDGGEFGGWERVKFKDILISYRLGGNYSNSENKTPYPLIKMGNLGRGTISTNKIEYIPCEEKIDAIDLIKTNDLFFNTRNTLELVGKVAIWRDELPHAYYNSNLMRLDFENNIFMHYLLNERTTLEKLKSIASGTTSVAAIYTKDLLKINLEIPCLEEQTKIANFLSSIDQKIEVVVQQIEQAKQWKKGLLQQMFV